VVSYYTKIKTDSLVNPYEELFGEEIVNVFNIRRETTSLLEITVTTVLEASIMSKVGNVQIDTNWRGLLFSLPAFLFLWHFSSI